MFLYGITIFLSTFLLFQVQPIIAKLVLPWFGGSSAVWTTCMLFFQSLLLAGYGYAHWLNGRRGRFAQAGVHSVLLALSLIALPIIPKESWKPEGTEDPVWLLLGLLAVTVGMPYFLLSATSPLLQAWYARTHSGTTPYRLFALSNLASMLALLSYPPVVEQYLATRLQAQLWSVAYAGFAALCAAIAWRSGQQAEAPRRQAAVEPAPAPGWKLRLLWMALAACASTLLLAVTTFLTQDVAAIPFLWIVPLSAYLLSFIISFESPRLYRRPVYFTLLPVALGGAAYRIWTEAKDWPLVTVIAFMTGALFVFCMICHGELAGLKPHPRHLTGFYLMVSLGGALGGLFVGLLAPTLFNSYYEFPLGLAMCAALAATLLLVRPSAGRQPWRRLAVLVPLAVYLCFLGMVVRDYVKDYHFLARNFYGRLAVYDDRISSDEPDAARHLLHGAIEHGEQFLSANLRRTPVTYFCPKSGIGIAMHALEGLPRKIGIVGLGCGTLAAYGMPGDIMRIYEINPLVVEIAQHEFTYLRDTPARIELVLGDGRLSLERERDQRFDLLVIDAFSGDAIPVHLITHEAFRTYLRHLKPDGVLALNISNRYLDLAPVIERAASAFNKITTVYDYDPSGEDSLCSGCTWALAMDRATRSRFPKRDGGRLLQAHVSFREWTDDFSNMQTILR
jgi:hypothetical protein